MQTLRITLKPLTAFATPLHGDTLFGQLCWALRDRHGTAFLTACLQGYTANDPFLVVADPFPSGYWPRPQLPSALITTGEKGAGEAREVDKKHVQPPGDKEEESAEERKVDKKRVWLPSRQWQRPLPAWIGGNSVRTFAFNLCRQWQRPLPVWIGGCKDEKGIWNRQERQQRPQPRNAINRLTGTTGSGADGFAPYNVDQIWFPAGPEVLLDLWLLHDPARLPEEKLLTALRDVGSSGYGKDASTGLGKFTLESDVDRDPLPRQKNSNAWLTLGFCAPQAGGFDPERSFYQVFTRFGRHGAWAALTGNPYKSPVLLARAGAVLTPRAFVDRPFIGRGLGGDGTLSRVIPETVHQGYCPVVGIQMPWKEMEVSCG
ncbi:MAG: CRISPR-associated protein Csm7 [Magnetococcales bacterium]|nr:CRISPR-associated protein Csm7 [Magnetococcales bacterium]